jgi:hypothetical protein
MTITSQTCYTLAIGKDAGLLREYLAIKQGHVFIHGAAPRTYNRGMGLAGKLARMTKLPLDTVVTDLANDARALGVQ